MTQNKNKHLNQKNIHNKNKTNTLKQNSKRAFSCKFRPTQRKLLFTITLFQRSIPRTSLLIPYKRSPSYTAPSIGKFKYGRGLQCPAAAAATYWPRSMTDALQPCNALLLRSCKRPFSCRFFVSCIRDFFVFDFWVLCVFWDCAVFVFCVLVEIVCVVLWWWTCILLLFLGAYFLIKPDIVSPSISNILSSSHFVFTFQCPCTNVDSKNLYLYLINNILWKYSF